jgi:transposase-like protein
MSVKSSPTERRKTRSDQRAVRCTVVPAVAPGRDRWQVDETYLKVAGRWVYHLPARTLGRSTRGWSGPAQCPPGGWRTRRRW